MKRFASIALTVLAVALSASAFAQTKDQYLRAAPGAQMPLPPPQPASKDAKKAPKGITLCQPPGTSKPQPC
jgi:hypothetical protein